MESTILIILIICIVGVAVGAVIFSLWFYMRQKKARLKLAEAEAMYGAKQEAERLKKANKKSWKQRLITRKTIRYGGYRVCDCSYNNMYTTRVRQSIVIFQF